MGRKRISEPIGIRLAAVDDEVVTAGAEDLDPGRRSQAGRVRVLVPQRRGSSGRGAVTDGSARGPKAVSAEVPHGIDGLGFDSITSATKVIASVWSPAMGIRCSGSQPSRIDSPSRRSLIRPGGAGSGTSRGWPSSRPTRCPGEFRTSFRSRSPARRGPSCSCRRGRHRSGRPGWCRSRRTTGSGVPDVCDDVVDVVGHDALAEVAELHHDDDAVDHARRCRRPRTGVDHVELGDEAQFGVPDRPLHRAECRRSDESHRRRDAGTPHGLDVLDP